jgi:hypothetical protein
MATSVVVSVGKYEFLVVLPDKPGVREERFEVREHALNLSAMHCCQYDLTLFQNSFPGCGCF